MIVPEPFANPFNRSDCSSFDSCMKYAEQQFFTVKIYDEVKGYEWSYPCPPLPSTETGNCGECHAKVCPKAKPILTMISYTVDVTLMNGFILTEVHVPKPKELYCPDCDHFLPDGEGSYFGFRPMAQLLKVKL